MFLFHPCFGFLKWRIYSAVLRWCNILLLVTMLWHIKQMSRTSTKSWQIKFFTKKGAFQIFYIVPITSLTLVENPCDLYNEVLNSGLYLHEEFQRIMPLVLPKKTPTPGDLSAIPQ